MLQLFEMISEVRSRKLEYIRGKKRYNIRVPVSNIATAGIS